MGTVLEARSGASQDALSSDEVASIADEDITPFSTADCTSSRFCMWSATSYGGTYRSVSGVNTTPTLSYTVNSIWNRRSQAAWLYNNAGTSAICYLPNQSATSVPSGYTSPAKVFLSPYATC